MVTLRSGECLWGKTSYLLDSIASVKLQGISGEKYIQVSLGGDMENFEEHGLIVDTESAVDIESLISKFAFGSAK